jgi:basic membrane protein A
MISRRDLLSGFALAAVPNALRSSAARPLTLGFLYNGPKNDLGYNQSHAEGRLALVRCPG